LDFFFFPPSNFFKNFFFFLQVEKKKLQHLRKKISTVAISEPTFKLETHSTPGLTTSPTHTAQPLRRGTDVDLHDLVVGEEEKEKNSENFPEEKDKRPRAPSAQPDAPTSAALGGSRDTVSKVTKPTLW
jgi:hypothetical protein